MTSPPRQYTLTTFVDGEAVNPVKWYARVSRVLNYLLALLGTGAQARFTAAITAAVTIPTGINVSFDTLGSIIEDTAGGWSPSTDVYIVQSAGTYLWGMGMKVSGGTAAQPNPVLYKNGSPLIDARTPGSLGGAGSMSSGYVRCGVGDTLAVRNALAAFPSFPTTTLVNYFTLAQISYN